MLILQCQAGGSLRSDSAGRGTGEVVKDSSDMVNSSLGAPPGFNTEIDARCSLRHFVAFIQLFWSYERAISELSSDIYPYTLFSYYHLYWNIIKSHNSHYITFMGGRVNPTGHSQGLYSSPWTR